MIVSKPAFEIITETAHIKIWANGMIEGITGTVINRIPQIAQEFALYASLDEKERKDLYEIS